MANNAKALRDLAEIAAKVRDLPNIQKELAKKMGRETLRFQKQMFTQEVDPYGKPWPKKKVPNGRKQLHGKTGQLRKFRLKHYSKDGFITGSDAPYQVYINRGTVNMRRRQLHPDGNAQLPAKWLAAYRTISRNVVKKHFKR